VERASNRAAERGAPLELEERGRDVRRQADRDAGREVEPGVERGRATGADRWAFRVAADAAGGECEVEGAGEDPAEGRHSGIVPERASLPLTWARVSGR
jgi:hypothetical protein